MVSFSKEISLSTLSDIRREFSRRELELHPLDPNRSNWDCEVESGAIRVGWSVVKGVSYDQGKVLLRERMQRPFRDLFDFLLRVPLTQDVLRRLAFDDTFRCFNLSPREALWDILCFQLLTRLYGEERLGLLLAKSSAPAGRPSARPSAQEVRREIENTFMGSSDLRTGRLRSMMQELGLVHREHPMLLFRVLRPQTPRQKISDLREAREGAYVRLTGLYLSSTRACLEDETGVVEIHLSREEETSQKFVQSGFHEVRGRLVEKRILITG